MSASTPTPQDAGLPPPPTIPTIAASPSSIPVPTQSPSPTTTKKPTLLHLGADIRWNHTLYATLSQKFHIERSYSMPREDFKKALQERRWGDFVAMYRPFWNTGGEMGDWDRELM
jgi:hypothetical protein